MVYKSPYEYDSLTGRSRTAPSLPMVDKPSRLPEFENPPVSEVALSIEFVPLENWHSPHAGLFWSQISKDYPYTEVQPALASQIEKFGDEFWQRPTVQIEMVDPDVARVWFLSEPKTALIQVQRNRFIVNWRKVKGDETYPRYLAHIKPRFERELGKFKAFLSEHKVGELAILQCEVTYVNDIVRGEAWTSFADSLSLFSWWTKRGDAFLPAPETLSVSCSYPMPDGMGRLHLATQHVRRQFDGREAVQLRLTARGKPLATTEKAALEWLDIGHEWVVRAFADLTSARAHELWRKR